MMLRAMAPIAPHLAEELWNRGGYEGSVHAASWPTADQAALVSETITWAVQVNGKVRGQVELATDADVADVIAAAKADPNVARHVGDATIRREIVVPGKLINLVVAN
jgi:leucyl-tRNA synthetase